MTLGLQAVLVYAFVFPFVAYVGALAPFLAGSVLLLVPGRWRWAGYAAVVVSWPVLTFALPPGWPGAANAATAQPVLDTLFFAAVTAEIGLVVYGLAWLAALARELEGLRGKLAAMAVVQERLRVANDGVPERATGGGPRAVAWPTSPRECRPSAGN